MKNVFLFVSISLLLFSSCTDYSEPVWDEPLLEYKNSDQELIGETLGAIFFEYSQIGKEFFHSKIEKLNELDENTQGLEILQHMTSDLPNSRMLKKKLEHIVYNTGLLTAENRPMISEAMVIYHNKLDSKTNLRGIFRTWNKGNGSCGQRIFNSFLDSAIAVASFAIAAPTTFVGAIPAGIAVVSEVGNLFATAVECSQ